MITQLQAIVSESKQEPPLSQAEQDALTRALNERVMILMEDPDFNPEMRQDAEQFIRLPKRYTAQTAQLMGTAHEKASDGNVHLAGVAINGRLLQALLGNLSDELVRDFLDGVLVKEIGLVRLGRRRAEHG